LLPFLPVVCGLLLLVVDPPVQQAMRLGLFDQYQRWSPRAYVDVPVRIVDIDDASLARLGQWPWPRNRMAELLDRLGAAGAVAVGFDVMFAEPDRTSPRAIADLWQLSGELRQAIEDLPDHDRAFAERLRQGNAILGFAVERGHPDSAGKAHLPVLRARFIHAGEAQTDWLPGFTSAVTSLPELERAAKGNGALTFVPDGDGIVRRVPLLLQISGTPIPTLVTETLRVAQDTPNVIVKSAGHQAGLQEVKVGGIAVPTTAQGEVWVHYTQAVSERYVPAWQVFESAVAAERIAGNLVLVGSSAQGLMDLRFSPFGLVPGVEVHAQVLEQILSGHFLERPGWARGAEAMLLMMVGMAVGFLALRTRALVAAVVCTLLVAGLLGGGWLTFAKEGLLLDSVTPAIGTLLTFLVCSLAHHFASEREERWVKDAFSHYVSPNRVKHLVAHHEDMALGGRRQECSFVFTDLADFTGLMEGIDPGRAVALLNAYLDGMIAIAFRHEGTLDRIVGDAVAIVFSAPVSQDDHRQRALACALEMDTFACRYAGKLQDEGIPFGMTRIGVHGGKVIVGNFGGANIFDYRALGDPVNTASRLESANKQLGTRVCVSQFILADCPQAARPIGRLVLKGKHEAIATFEPVQADGAGLRVPEAEYRAAFALLAAGDEQAMACFAELAAAYPGDPLVTLHHRRLSAGEHGDLIVLGEK
jgi:adenylate cyclase